MQSPAVKSRAYCCHPRVDVLAADEYVLTNGVRTMELYHLQGNSHDASMIMAYLPKEKLLIETDVYTPSPPRSAQRGLASGLRKDPLTLDATGHQNRPPFPPT